MHVHGSNRWVWYEEAGMGRVGEGRVGGVVGVWRGVLGEIFANNSRIPPPPQFDKYM